jgi:hypothetical protein
LRLVWKLPEETQSKGKEFCKGWSLVNREVLIMILFTVLSVAILIYVGVANKSQLRLWFALAISADFFSVVGNNIGISLGFWEHQFRIFPQAFNTSVVYDMLFFPATLLLYLIWMPRESIWKLVYSVLWASVLSVLEWWLEGKTKLIGYGRGWTFYKTGMMYLVTYVAFYWLYRWLLGQVPGEQERAKRSR